MPDVYLRAPKQFAYTHDHGDACLIFMKGRQWVAGLRIWCPLHTACTFLPFQHSCNSVILTVIVQSESVHSGVQMKMKIYKFWNYSFFSILLKSKKSKLIPTGRNHFSSWLRPVAGGRKQPESWLWPVAGCRKQLSSWSRPTLTFLTLTKWKKHKQFQKLWFFIFIWTPECTLPDWTMTVNITELQLCWNGRRVFFSKHC